MRRWALFCLLVTSCAKAPAPGLAYYDWEPLTPLPAQDARWLKGSGAQAWVKLGHFEATVEGARFEPELAVEALEPYRGGSVTFCFRFENSFLRALQRLDAKKTAVLTLAAFERGRAGARAQGVEVTGLQLDLDAPQSRLGWYNEYLGALRQGLPQGQALSITCLPSWFRHPLAFWPVARRCDYLVPLFFGDSVAARIENLQPLADARSLGWTWRLGRIYGRPLWAGLPAYQQVLVYGADGELLSAQSGLTLGSLQGRPELELVSTGKDGPLQGSRARFRVRRGCVVDSIRLSPGFQLVWQAVDASQLSAMAFRARALGGQGFRGWAIYRLGLQQIPPSMVAKRDIAGAARRDRKRAPDRLCRLLVVAPLQVHHSAQVQGRGMVRILGEDRLIDSCRIVQPACTVLPHSLRQPFVQVAHPRVPAGASVDAVLSRVSTQRVSVRGWCHKNASCLPGRAWVRLPPVGV